MSASNIVSHAELAGGGGGEHGGGGSAEALPEAEEAEALAAGEVYITNFVMQ